jgi:NAD(P)-dependent dehydrogenase (short-subunit alcohol dehydrogenase family)
MTVAQRVWLITGISSGFGRHLAEQLLDRGDHVVGTVRKPESVADLRDKYPDLLRVEVLDVRDTEALRSVVERAATELGRIDVVISNAGYGVFGAAEELSDEQVASVLATNLTASVQLIRAALPRMRAAGGGRLIQLSSYGGQTAFPGEFVVPRHQVGRRGLLRDPARMATAIIESVEVNPAPLRMVLGSQALESTISTLETRIADFRTQKELAASTDYPSGE